MKEIKSTINLKSLSEQLSIDDLALLLLYKANFRNNEDFLSSKEYLDQFEKEFKHNIFINFNKSLEKLQPTFIFKEVFTSDFETQILIIRSLIHLSTSNNGYLRFLLYMPDNLFNQLEKANLIFISKNEDTYYQQIVFANDSLKDLLSSLKRKDGSFDFEEVIDSLIIYLKNFNFSNN